MPKHTDIPSICYDLLRAVAESRVRRAMDPNDRIGLELPRLSNNEIFNMMPDRQQIDWTKEAQPVLTEVTLNNMYQELNHRISTI